MGWRIGIDAGRADFVVPISWNIVSLAYTAGSVLVAVGASCLTVWLLHRYSLLVISPRTRNQRWYVTWRRPAVVTVAGLLLGALGQLSGVQGVDGSVVFVWILFYLSAHLYGHIGVRRRVMQIECALLWIAWAVGASSLGGAELEFLALIYLFLANSAAGHAVVAFGRSLQKELIPKAADRRDLHG